MSKQNTSKLVQTISQEEEKKAFNEKVEYLMNKARVPKKLAELAARIGSEANIEDSLCFLDTIKEEGSNYRVSWKGKVSVKRYLEERLSSFAFDENEIEAIEEYWLS